MARGGLAAPALQDWTTVVRAGFAAPVSGPNTQSVPGYASNGSAFNGPAHNGPSSNGTAPAVAMAAGGGAPRRNPWLRRGVLIPVASAVVVVAAAATVLAATLGGPGGSSALTGGSPTASAGALAAATRSVPPTADSPGAAASTSAAPAQSASPPAAATQAATTQAPSSAVTVTAAAPAQGSTSSTPTPTPPGPKSISGTYTFTRQVVTCTFSSCGTTPNVTTFSCPAAGSCTGYWSYWGTHPATFDGTTIHMSFIGTAGSGTGIVDCNGTPVPTAVTLDINVLSWTAGQGGAVRTPTRMQGTYTESVETGSSCAGAGFQMTVSYG